MTSEKAVFVRASLVSAQLLVLAGSMLAFFDISIWWLELFSHFVFQYFLLSFFFLFSFALLRMRSCAAIAVCALVLNVCNLAPFYLNGRQPNLATATSKPSIRILLLNVYTDNPHHDELVELLGELEPDIFAIVEMSQVWRDVLDDLPQFKNSIAAPQEDNFGIGLYLKEGLLRKGEVKRVDDNVPYIKASLNSTDGDWNMMVVHSVPPMNQSWKDKRDAFINVFAQSVRRLREPTIVCGDFNASPWTKSYREFAVVSRLKDSQEAMGLKRTWISASSVVAIPLDFCFIPDSWRVLRHEVVVLPGSDHYGVLLEVARPTEEQGT